MLAGGLADMVFTDPPYNVDYEGKTARKLKIGNDSLGGQFYDFLREACANVLAVTKEAVYMCILSELHTLYRAFTDAGGHWSTFLNWAKHHFTLGRSDYQRQYEPILYATACARSMGDASRNADQQIAWTPLSSGAEHGVRFESQWSPECRGRGCGVHLASKTWTRKSFVCVGLRCK